MNISGGWSKSPHFIHDAMPFMSGAEYKCTAVLVRETYGYHRPRVRLTYQDFMQQTGIGGKATISAALKAIEARGFFRRTGSPSEWQICQPLAPEDESGEQADEIDQSANRSDFAAHGSKEGPNRSHSGEDGRVRRSISALERSVIELQRSINELLQANSELNRSNAELCGLLTELIRSIAGQNSPLNEPSAPLNGSLIAPNGRAKGAYRAKNEPANSPAIEPKNGPNSSYIELSNVPDGSEFEPLQLYKDKKTPSGKEREGEESKQRPRPRARQHVTRKISGSGKNGRNAPPHSSPRIDGKPPPHPDIPRPRSAAESELAWHPATAVWLEAGMAWPGWERLQDITQRIGQQPQAETLCKARKMWLMAGYRIANIAGILDWYESLSRDENWQPFTRSKGQLLPVAQDIDAPQSPSMAMLFKLREEIINESETDDDRLFNHAASGIPPFGSRTADHQCIPALPG